MWQILLIAFLIGTVSCTLDTPLCLDGGEPVCARDGNEIIYFENECKLNVYSYKQLFAGKTRPTRVALEDCFSNCAGIVCPAIYQPVCAQLAPTGPLRTVPNVCLVNQLICESRQQWIIVGVGPCPVTSEPIQDTYSATASRYPPYISVKAPTTATSGSALDAYGTQTPPQRKLSNSDPEYYQAPAPVSPPSAPTYYADPMPDQVKDSSTNPGYSAVSPPSAPAYYTAPTSAQAQDSSKDPGYSANTNPGYSAEPSSSQTPSTYPCPSSYDARTPAQEQGSSSKRDYYVAPSTAYSTASASSPAYFAARAPAPSYYNSPTANDNESSTSDPDAAPAPKACPSSYSESASYDQPAPSSNNYAEAPLKAVTAVPSLSPSLYQVQNSGAYETKDPNRTEIPNSYTATVQDPASLSYPTVQYVPASESVPVSSSYAVPSNQYPAESPASYSSPAQELQPKATLCTGAEQSREEPTPTAYSTPAQASANLTSVPAPASYVSSLASDPYSAQEQVAYPAQAAPQSPCPASYQAPTFSNTALEYASPPARKTYSDPVSAPAVDSYSTPAPTPAINASPAQKYTSKPSADAYSPPAPANYSAPATEYTSPSDPSIDIYEAAPASFSVGDSAAARKALLYPNQATGSKAESYVSPDQSYSQVISQAPIEAPASYLSTEKCVAPASKPTSYSATNQDTSSYQTPINELDVYPAAAQAPLTASSQYAGSSQQNTYATQDDPYISQVKAPGLSALIGKWIDNGQTYGGSGSQYLTPFYYQPTYMVIEYHGSKGKHAYK